VIEKKMSEKVTARIGYDDGHIEIGIQTGIPLVGMVWMKIEANELFMVGDVLNQAFEHLKALGQLKPRRRAEQQIGGNGEMPDNPRYIRRR
jgi:hypothetical protein